MTQSFRSLVLCTMCSVLLLTGSSAAVAQQPSRPDPSAPAGWQFDFDLFETLLQSRALESRSAAVTNRTPWNRVFRSPAESVMIFTGRFPSDVGWREVHQFLADGGVMLIASSEPAGVYGFFSIDTGPAVTNDPRFGWLGHDDCLQVFNIDRSQPITENVGRIVTNRSGWLRELRSSLNYRWTPLARLPENLRPPRSSDRLLAAIATGRGRAGRLIVFADDSLLSNGMLWHGDNLALLLNTVEELTHDGRREYAFLHNGRPVQNRVPELLVEEAINRQEELPDIPPEALADLPADELLEIGNAVVTSIEDSDVLNELAVDRPRSLQDRFYRRSILLALCAAAIATLLIRSWLTGQSTLPWSRRRRPPEASDPPASLSRLQYDQAAQALSRDVCRMLTDSQDPADWQTQLGRDGSLWRQLSTRSESPQATADTIAQILDWSEQPPSASMSRSEFERFGESIYRLKQLHVPEDGPEARLAWT